jgi:hypothetical protein
MAFSTQFISKIELSANLKRLKENNNKMTVAEGLGG